MLSIYIIYIDINFFHRLKVQAETFVDIQCIDEDHTASLICKSLLFDN